MNIDVVRAHDLIDAARESASGAAIERSVRFRTSYCMGSPRIRVDPDRLVQVLVNFLSNAVKYGPESGTVYINTVWIENTLRISVRDQGPGIPEDDRHRIFEKFFRVESESHRQVGGTGLGLSISKSIIDALGGKIGFECGEGRGATFYVEFPVVTWTTEEAAEIPARRVEDHEQIRTFTTGAS